jgi:hypothetical protein
VKDSFYERLFHESEDYWMPKGFHLSPFFLSTPFEVEWKDVHLLGKLEHEDELFHQFLRTGMRLLWTATDDLWASRCVSLIEAQLLVMDESRGKHIGWMGLTNSYEVDGAISIWRGSPESAAKEHLRRALLDIPGWSDPAEMIQGPATHEQYGLTMMMGFGLVKKIVAFIKSRHLEIPRYIGGAMRLGGTARARREVDDLFDSLGARPRNRDSVIEALVKSRLDKKLYFDHLTKQERGQALGDVLGL